MYLSSACDTPHALIPNSSACIQKTSGDFEVHPVKSWYPPMLSRMGMVSLAWEKQQDSACHACPPSQTAVEVDSNEDVLHVFCSLAIESRQISVYINH